MDRQMDRKTDRHDQAKSHFLQFCKHVEKYEQHDLFYQTKL